MKVHGRCHCGQITYEAEVEPSAVSFCHCRDCQSLSGAAFRANVHAPAESFRISGSLQRYIKIGNSGAKRLHTFCGTCGAPVYSADPENAKTYTLRVGALQEAEAFGPVRRQIWLKRRLPWLPEIKSAEAFEGQA